MPSLNAGRVVTAYNPYTKALARYSVPYYGTARKYMAAYKIAKWGYKNRRNIGRAYKTAKRMRKAKLQKRTQPSVKQSKTKKNQDSVPTGPPTGLTMGRLQIRVIPYPSGPGAANQEVNRRLSNTYDLRGVKICRVFEYDANSNTTQDIGPIEVNYALVQIKHDMNSTSFDAEIKDKFWRDYSSATVKYRNWSDYIETSVWSAEYNCLPLNPTSDFTVLTRMKKRLCPDSSAIEGWGRNIWKIDRYFKIKKKIEVPTSNDALPLNPILELIWYNTVTPRRFPDDPTAFEYIKTYKMNTVYFRNMSG